MNIILDRMINFCNRIILIIIVVSLLIALHAASQDNNVEWNGLYFFPSENVEHQSFTYQNPLTVKNSDSVDIYLRSYANDLTDVYLRIYFGAEEFYPFIYPVGVSVDNYGFVYVCDAYDHSIKVFKANGSFIYKFGSYGTGDGEFNCPYDAVVDSHSNIYISDQYNYRIQKFKLDRTTNSVSFTFLSEWGTQGTNSGEFDRPLGLAIDTSDNIYVADVNNYRIEKFTSDGSFLGSFGSQGTGDMQFQEVRGLEFFGGYIYAVDCQTHQVQVFNTSGSFKQRYGSFGTGDSDLNEPVDIAFDEETNIYVLNRGDGQVRVFNSSWTFLRSWGRTLFGSEFTEALGIAVDKISNTVCIVDGSTKYIKEYNTFGVKKYEWNGYGEGGTVVWLKGNYQFDDGIYSIWRVHIDVTNYKSWYKDIYYCIQAKDGNALAYIKQSVTNSSSFVIQTSEQDGYEGTKQISKDFSFTLNEDRTPPAIPSGFVSTYTGYSMAIFSWNANSEDDLFGYNIYRSLDNVVFTKLNSVILSNTIYTDRGLFSGETYYYSVTALDYTPITNNESGYSASISLTIRDKAPIIRKIDDSGDDDGPGTYIYPTASVFNKGAFDILSFDIRNIDEENLVQFRVYLSNLEYKDWNPEYGNLSLQKIDIYIDAKSGGSDTLLSTRKAYFQSSDKWDYAIVAAGWYKGIIVSNNTNDENGYSSYTDDEDIFVASSSNANYVVINVNSLYIGGTISNSDISNWDIMIVMTGNGDSYSPFGGTRDVTKWGGEWNFGGGDEDDKNRDSNIIDLLAITGKNKETGASQYTMLNYKLTNYYHNYPTLQIEKFVDTTPPVITYTAPSYSTPPMPIKHYYNDDILIKAKVSDESGLSSVRLYWFETGSTNTNIAIFRQGADSDMWYAEIYSISSETGNEIDEINYYIEAIDKTGLKTILTDTIVSNLYKEQVVQVEDYEYDIEDTSLSIDIDDGCGTEISIPGGAIPETPEQVTLYIKGALPLDIPNTDKTELENLYVGRFISLIAGTRNLIEINNDAEISIHYSQYRIGDAYEKNFAVYRYEELSETWIYVGGTVDTNANLINFKTRHFSLFGIFVDRNNTQLTNELIGNVRFSLNAFSPNGDGLYDSTDIHFSISENALVSAYILDKNGWIIKTLLLESKAEVNNIPYIDWDGTNDDGDIVDAGVYILKLTAVPDQDTEFIKPVNIFKEVLVVK